MNLSTHYRVYLSIIAAFVGTDTNFTSKEKGYSYLFGLNSSFISFETHPNQMVGYKGVYSNAAGRYMITYESFKSVEGESFSPIGQDLIAIKLINKYDAIKALEEDDIITFVRRLSEANCFITSGSQSSFMEGSVHEIVDYYLKCKEMKQFSDFNLILHQNL